MKKISHSKYKNTGIIFEILVRHLTNEALSNNEPKTINVIKKYFSNTELSKENQLYQTLLKQNNLTESRADVVLNTVVGLYNKIDTKKLNKEKYNLIKEIKEKYDFDNFFKTKIPNYKILASLYTIFESTTTTAQNPKHIVNSKINILEHLILDKVPKKETTIYEEMNKMDKGERYLVYKIMTEKFNEKYKGLNTNQRLILKEYINSISTNSDGLQKLIKENFITLKKSISENIPNIEDKVTQIKLQNILTYIEPVLESKTLSEDNITLLFQFQDLNEEINNIGK